MPGQPTREQVHINRPLTMMSIAYLQRAEAFVALKMAPMVPVDKQSDLYFIFDRNDFFRDTMQLRGPSEESAGSGYNLATDSYNSKVYALHKDVSDMIRANSDMPLNPDRNAIQWLTQMGLIRLEVDWAAKYFSSTSTWDTVLNGATGAFVQWDDQAGSDPITDIREGVLAVLQRTGFKPNKLVLGARTFKRLQEHPRFRQYVQYTAMSSVTRQILAQIFELEQVVVCESVQATNVEGATGVYGFIQGNHALLEYVPPAPALEVPSAAYTFFWRGASYGLGEVLGIKQFRMEHLESDRTEIQMAWDSKLVSSALGYFFLNAVAS